MNSRSLSNLVKSRNSPRPRITAVTQHRFFSMLLEGAGVDEIIEEVGVCRTTLHYHLRALHKPAEGKNLIFISDWVGRNSSIRIWKWGPGKSDVARPKMTREQKNISNQQIRRRQRDTKLLGLSA